MGHAKWNTHVDHASRLNTGIHANNTFAGLPDLRWNNPLDFGRWPQWWTNKNRLLSL
ncbi:hypothetical protein M404DRAFT_999643, partial [Pisolithus tinctorius Marx 270]